MSNEIYETLSSLSGSEPRTTKFSNMEEGKAVHRNYPDIIGDNINKFTINFIKIIDVSIIKNNKYFMTKEQQKFFEKYCTEANTLLSNEMKQFDTFLGKYRGEDNG